MKIWGFGVATKVTAESNGKRSKEASASGRFDSKVNGSDWTVLARSVGSEVRKLRTDLGLKANQLAAASGLSVGMLSKIENGSSAPSFQTLMALAGALEVPVSRFFTGYEQGGDCSVVKAGRGVLVERQGAKAGQKYELIGHLLSGKLSVEPYLVTLDEGAVETPTFQHSGVELVHMLEGGMVYRYGDQSIELAPGDTLLFDCTAPHGPEKVLKRPVKFISAVFTERD